MKLVVTALGINTNPKEINKLIEFDYCTDSVNIKLLNTIQTQIINIMSNLYNITRVDIRIESDYFTYSNFDCSEDWVEVLKRPNFRDNDIWEGFEDVWDNIHDENLIKALRYFMYKIEAYRHSIYINNPDNIDRKLYKICSEINNVVKMNKRISELKIYK